MGGGGVVDPRSNRNILRSGLYTAYSNRISESRFICM
jgi:hypothetical protein